MNKILFYDTCSLLKDYKNIINSSEDFFISSITYKELEGIKTSMHKDDETKYNARCLVKALKHFRKEGRCHLILFRNNYLEPFKEYDLIENDDLRIIATAYSLKDNDLTFYTDDLSCQEIALSVGINAICSIDEEDDDYTGFKIIRMSELELAEFYSTFNNNENKYNLLEGEYLIICDKKGEVIQRYRWFEKSYQEIKFETPKSKMFGKFKAKDTYQLIALDCLSNNQISMLRGPAGSGKSYLAFSYMFSLLEKGTIDKIVVFCNTVAAKGAAKLGFYPGSKDEKLLDSQIGNFLSSKLGGKIIVEELIEEEKLILLPMADIRGYDTTGMNAAVYITEAQNLDIELMKLALTRISDDCICILDGDSEAQVDLAAYAGNNNGMRRVSKVFRGTDVYGEVTLQKVYRSKIAEIAQTL